VAGTEKADLIRLNRQTRAGAPRGAQPNSGRAAAAAVIWVHTFEAPMTGADLVGDAAEHPQDHRFEDFPELLLIPGVGPRTVQALAMVAEVVHGAPYRFTDPARFSVAHGGKDRHPFPVPLRVYDTDHSGAEISGPESKIGPSGSARRAQTA